MQPLQYEIALCIALRLSVRLFRPGFPLQRHQWEFTPVCRHPISWKYFHDKVVNVQRKPAVEKMAFVGFGFLV